MALINCPECKHQISDKATSCPKCGYKINSEIKKLPKTYDNYLRKFKSMPFKYVFILLAIIIGSILLLNINNQNGKYGTVEKSKIDGYSTYKSNILNISFAFPNNYKIINKDNFIYTAKAKSNNEAVIPYIIIGTYTDFSSPYLFLTDFTSYMKKQYTDLKEASQIMYGVIGDKTVYGITYNYTVDSTLIVDNRYAFSINNVIYMIGSKEVKQNTKEINNIVTNIITTLKEEK